MKRMRAFLALVAVCLTGLASAGAQAPTVRVATYNTSLNRYAAGQLVSDLSSTTNSQARSIAQVIQHQRPDIVLLNEFDYDAAHQAATLFQGNYLGVQQGSGTAGDPYTNPISYPYVYVAPSNTGELPAATVDFNNDGWTDQRPDDAYGYGHHEGQYGMVLYSKYPILTNEVRTFREFLWKDMPGNLLPTGWYDSTEQSVFRLSSKSHWDVPVDVDGRTVHLLASHPTPPVFDGPEDRNGRRNHDEIRFWADYVRADPADSAYIYDDDGVYGGLDPAERFVILGDQNADTDEGDAYPGAIDPLLDHPRVLYDRANPPAAPDGDTDTATFGLQADYVLPSSHKGMQTLDQGVFWPTYPDPLYGDVSATDHRMVWLDLLIPQDGDLDADGSVGIGDLGRLSGHYDTASGAEWSTGDIDGDGDVDEQDFLLLKARYGHLEAFPAAGRTGDHSAAIPEPASAGLLVLAAATVARRRDPRPEA